VHIALIETCPLVDQVRLLREPASSATRVAFSQSDENGMGSDALVAEPRSSKPSGAFAIRTR
jgi:hypothetical protein